MTIRPGVRAVIIVHFGMVKTKAATSPASTNPTY